MSTFVVGDIHGRRKQLGHLLSLLPREAGRDTLVLYLDIYRRAPLRVPRGLTYVAPPAP